MCVQDSQSLRRLSPLFQSTVVVCGSTDYATPLLLASLVPKNAALLPASVGFLGHNTVILFDGHVVVVFVGLTILV